MAESYDPSDDCPHPEMDELLCEYVDGTMDPSVRCAFEEYLHSDPALEAHVERLARTRRLLCTYGCSMQAPQNFQRRLNEELTAEMMAGLAPLFEQTCGRLRHIAMATSLLVVATLFAVVAMPEISEDPMAAADDIMTAEEVHVIDEWEYSAAAPLYQTRTFAPEHPPLMSQSFGTDLTSSMVLSQPALRLAAQP